MVEEYFETPSDEPDWNPRYNIAPTQLVPVIRQNPKEPRRELSLMRWGLIPSWSKESARASRTVEYMALASDASIQVRVDIESCFFPTEQDRH
jgi:putative SOS response-associated peptidase YedK